MSCITEILKLKGDNEVFVPEGNWIAVEGGGSYKDHEYLIVLNTNGHRCGYVALHPEHKYSQVAPEAKEIASQPFYDYNKLEIDCHGGLTFMAPDHGLKELLPVACNDMWIGFDCGHCDDRCDIEAHRKYFGEELHIRKKTFFEAMNFPEYADQFIRNYEYVEKECQSIIDQLIAVA